MGTIDDIYEDLDTDISKTEFMEAVEAKVEQMGGLADDETAAMLIAHDLDGGKVETIVDIEPGLEEVKFLGKVTSVGDIRTFERDDESEGNVLNIDVADESGSIRVALWDDDAIAAAEDLDVGQTLRIKGRPKEGYSGVEVNADRVEPASDTTIDISVSAQPTIDQLSLGQSEVTIKCVILDTGSIRTFERDDGTEGQVSNLSVGDETSRIRVTLWDEQAEKVDELTPGESIEIIDGYVRERDGELELHLGSRGVIETLDEPVEFEPETTAIADLAEGDSVDIAGVVRSADPKRTFDRDDGSEGQVKNIRVQDQTGDIRVALWGEKADIDLTPGDEVYLAEVTIQEGWQEDLEASAGWQSTVTALDRSRPNQQGRNDDSADLTEFRDSGNDNNTETPSEGDSDEIISFTGVVVQPGDPVILDNGEETVAVETSETVNLGEEITVRGKLINDRIKADEVF